MREKERTEHSHISLNEIMHRQEEGEASGTSKRTCRLQSPISTNDAQFLHFVVVK